MTHYLKTVLFCVSLLAIATPALGWTETYSWTAVSGATSYKVEKSIDTGATWTLVASPAVPTYVYVGTETNMTIFRVSACNAAGCTMRAASGVWHNEVWQPLSQPSNLGVQ